MIKLRTKIPAFIGMFFNIWSFALMIGALVEVIKISLGYEGYNLLNFSVWGYILSLFSLIFYLVDAILCLIRATKKIDAKFNLIVFFLILVAIPVALFVGQQAGAGMYIWNAYYLIVLILEIFSIVRIIKFRTKTSHT